MGGLRRRWPLTGTPLSSALGRWTQPGFVKSVQSGTVAITAAATSATLTITAVDTSNALLLHCGYSYSANSDQADIERVVLTFTNSTTITGTRVTGNAAVPTVSVMVIEFMPGVLKSVQRGSISLANVTSNTATINPITLAKSLVFWLGASSGTGTAPTTNDLVSSKVVLTNATTVTASRASSDANQFTVGYQVAEFY